MRIEAPIRARGDLIRLNKVFRTITSVLGPGISINGLSKDNWILEKIIRII